MVIKKILIPAELDELSTKVINFSVNLAQRMNITEIILLNVIIPAHTQSFLASGDTMAAHDYTANRLNVLLIEKHQKLTEEKAEKFTTEQVQVKPFVRFNDSKTDLNRYMEEFDADLIVCGSRDEQTFLQTLFGTDTERIIRKTDYPLIILQDDADAWELNNILVAIDINEEDQNGLNDIAGFAKSLNARMQLLHVLTGESQSSNQAINKLQKLAVKNELDDFEINIVNNDSLEDGIRSFVRKRNPDMIAVLSQGRGKIHKLIFGSGTADIIKETDKPVFVSKIS